MSAEGSNFVPRGAQKPAGRGRVTVAELRRLKALSVDPPQLRPTVASNLKTLLVFLPHVEVR
jgi:hypothetical protein